MYSDRCSLRDLCDLYDGFRKAVYLFPKDNAFELIRYANANEKEMSSLILDSSSRLYKNNRDRNRLSQLVLDKLTAVYRSDIKEFFDISLNKSYLSTSNTYITFNMARFCREFAKQTTVKLGESEMAELYPVVAPRIRRQLQLLLQSFVPTSP